MAGISVPDNTSADEVMYPWSPWSVHRFPLLLICVLHMAGAFPTKERLPDTAKSSRNKLPRATYGRANSPAMVVFKMLDTGQCILFRHHLALAMRSFNFTNDGSDDQFNIRFR
jgi:hypothetical protein